MAKREIGVKMGSKPVRGMVHIPVFQRKVLCGSLYV